MCSNNAVLDVAIATCEAHPGFCAGDDESLIKELKGVGISATPAVWNNPEIDWESFDAVLIRTTWDYTANLEEFITWMRRVEMQATILNPPSVAVSNIEKTYLKDLGEAAVPTVWIERGASVRDVDAAFADAASRGWERVVLKPVIGAGAEDLLIGALSNDIRLRAHISHVHKRCDVMLQPLIEGVRERGELSVVLIDGAITHAVRKTPTGNDYRVQIEFGGRYELESPSAEAISAVEAASVLWDEAPLYARVDLVEPEPDRYWIIEVELVEPELFFPLAPHAASVLGESLKRRVADDTRTGSK